MMNLSKIKTKTYLYYFRGFAGHSENTYHGIPGLLHRLLPIVNDTVTFYKPAIERFISSLKCKYNMH